MNEKNRGKQGPLAHTFEGALWELLQAKKDFKMTGKQVKILTIAKNNRNSTTFKELKRITKVDENGTSLFHVLRAIRKNQAELLQIADGKATIVTKAQSYETRSAKQYGEQVLKDLKKPRLSFGDALALVKRSMDQLQLTKKEKKIIKVARKEKDIFVKLKSLTKANKAGTYSPFDVIKTISKNRSDFYLMAGGKRFRPIEEKATPAINQVKKKLPLDTNYKYPTKTSRSIWTVRKK